MSFMFSSPPGAHERMLALCELARLHAESGDRITAVDLCRQALALEHDCLPAHLILAGIGLSGEHYRDLLEKVHRHFCPRTYLEIGVGDGSLLALADAVTLAIGVDAAADFGERKFAAQVRVFRETSDAFFAKHDVSAEFGGKPLDLALVHGVHAFEDALRTFINVERISGTDTRILIHDCYPLDETTASRRQGTTFWTGDLWKLIVCLKKYRPDLDVRTFAAPPSGLTMIRHPDPQSQVLSAEYDAICREFIPLPYAALAIDKRAALNLVAGDWETVRGHLA